MKLVFVAFQQEITTTRQLLPAMINYWCQLQKHFHPQPSPPTKTMKTFKTKPTPTTYLKDIILLDNNFPTSVGNENNVGPFWKQTTCTCHINGNNECLCLF